MNAAELQSLIATEMGAVVSAVPRSSADSRALESDEALDTLLQEGTAAIAEIDKLMRQLKIARDYLQAEGERLHQEMARYAQLTRTALAFAKTISEQVNDWRDY